MNAKAKSLDLKLKTLEKRVERLKRILKSKGRKRVIFQIDDEDEYRTSIPTRVDTHIRKEIEHVNSEIRRFEIEFRLAEAQGDD